MHTTFSNWSKANQAYPKSYSQGDFPAQTGAAERDTLGYTFRNQKDSVYRLSFTFAHGGRDLTLHFSACGLEGPLDLESWGLDNVKVTVHSNVPPPTDDNLLINGSFETGGTIQVGFPCIYGKWQGNFSQIIDSFEGIKPFKGSGMLRFMSTEDAKGGGSGRSSDIHQIVDVRPFRDLIATGQAIAQASAYFNRVPGDEQTDTQFSVTLSAYQGEPRSFPELASRYDELKEPYRDSASVYADTDLNTWERCMSLLALPENTDFIVVEVDAKENICYDVEAPEFDGHFVDAVSLRIGTLSGQLWTENAARAASRSPRATDGYPAGKKLKEITIEALIDGGSELWITPDGLLWQNLGFAKPGRHAGRNEPTWINELPWMPEWEKPNEERGPDKTELLPMLIGSTDFQFELLAVGKNMGSESIESRSPVEIRREGEALIFLFPDAQAGSRWYRFRLSSLPKPPEQSGGDSIKLRFDSPEALSQFVTPNPQVWLVENDRLIGQGIGPNEKPFLTYKTYFKEISKVVIKGSVMPATDNEVMLKGRRGIGQLPCSTNFRVSVGKINLIFNWEVRDENHYRNGQVCTVQKGHALTPGKDHTIVIEQIGQAVVVSVDNKPVYATEATLDGTVTVYPAHGSTISVSQIDITGVSDPQRAVHGHSHTNTF